jgi:hypothetical protein
MRAIGLFKARFATDLASEDRIKEYLKGFKDQR